MRKTALIICLLSAQFAYAQLTIKPIVKNDREVRSRQAETKLVNPATLPFWDDFSISTDSPDGIRIWGNDTTSQWNVELSKDVYVNATLAVNPPTYKVATFDGLDANRAFHSSANPWADQLVSDTIDLQGKANVVLSFYWQAGGNVELPDPGDSLILQFHRLVNGQSSWETVWSMDGSDLGSDQDSVFTQVAEEVVSKFLTQKFLFRFQSFGDKDGPFDAWHVDWIYLNEGRNKVEALTGYEEGSITLEPTSIISPFSSVPINQLSSDNKYIRNPETSFSYLNRDPGSVFEIDLNYAMVIKNSMDTLFTNNRASNPLTPIENYANVTVGFTGDTVDNNPFRLNEQDFSPIFAFDSVILVSSLSLFNDVSAFLEGTQVDLRVNDTIRNELLLHNYYAFDDGTAEYAAGTNISGGQVAVKFWLEERDTLTHVDIYFPNIDPASTGRPLTLKIFKQLNNDEPIRSQSISVINGTQIDEFTRYKLSRPLVLVDTFYVGYEQSTNEYIGIGFDRSNPEASKYIYENKTGLWEQNVRLTGALMIRPVFSKPDSLITGLIKKERLVVYPNPTKKSIRIDGAYESITLMDFSGKILLQERVNQVHDFSNLNTGLYLLTIHRKEGDQTIKIIKE